MQLAAGQLRVAGGSRLCGVLIVLVREILQSTDDEAVAIASQRLGWMGTNRSIGALELLTLDDGLELCTPDDRRQIKEEQRAERAEQAEFDALLADVRLARQRLRPANQPTGTKRVVLPRDLSQRDVRQLTPPGCSIWVNNVSLGWAGHCPPHLLGSQRLWLWRARSTQRL